MKSWKKPHKFAKCVSGKDATNRLDDLNETLANALEKKTILLRLSARRCRIVTSAKKNSKMCSG